MAVAIEFVNVIIRKSAVERSYPGGLDGFARHGLSNLTEDDHLLRVGFMSTEEAISFISELETSGLRHPGAEAASDIALVVWDDSAVPPWLSLGSLGGHRACWASDSSPGELAWPEPGFLLRCPRGVYESLSALVRTCGAEVHEAATAMDPCDLGTLRCARGDAEFMIQVVGERDGHSPVGLWGQRQVARRERFRVDVALIRDVVGVLTQAGAEPG